MNIKVSLSVRTIAVVGITLLALALGGSTTLGAQSIILILAGVLIFFYPPRLGLSRLPVTLFALFFATALAAFLPAIPGFEPAWRTHLTRDLHASLGPFRTPQPWLTLQACGLVFFGSIWSYYLLAQGWSPAEKSRALRLFAAGVVLLAAVSVAAYATGYHVPGWTQEENRGWFPNRNQTADVLALAGTITYAITIKCYQKQQLAGILWLAGLGLIGAALVITYSRSGITMFFAGVGLWHLGEIIRPEQGRTFALGTTLVLIFLTLFFLFGGKTLNRFVHASEPDTHPDAVDYRLPIQEDALKISLQTPILGVGLGNFEPVFTSMRQASADQNRTLHPESDWLWLAVEMGWAAPLLLAVGIWWWLGECLPFSAQSGESLRRAALVGFMLFLAHGLVDVSGHRLGSFLAAVLLAGAALSPTRSKLRLPQIAPYFRGLGAALCLIGGWWLGSFAANLGPPTTSTLARLQTEIDKAAATGDLAGLSQSANAALKIAPLNWTFYFRRASAEALQNGGTGPADTDFKIARFLEPNWVDLCLNEGQIWLEANQPLYCIEAWQEALRRAGPRAVLIYATMLDMAQSSPQVRQDLEKYASTKNDYLITFLRYATQDESKVELATLLTRDPDLRTFDSTQLRELLAAWNAHGDRADLANHLLAHEKWQAAGWPFLAQHYADQQDFQMACDIAFRYLAAPSITSLLPDQPLVSLEAQFQSNPKDLVEGIMLCQAQINAERIDDALGTITSLEKIKNLPPSIYFLKAQLLVKKQAWADAWNALQQSGVMVSYFQS